MGISTKTITVCTCDICGAECSMTDNEIYVQVNGGDGRDVGPAYVYGDLLFCQPYSVDKGVVCKACKIKWLKRYIAEQEVK